MVKSNKKIDWDSLKLQYYKSPIMGVKEFLESIGRTWNGTSQKRCKGWGIDKGIFLEKINKKAEKKIVQSLTEQRALLLTNMEKAKIRGLNELAIRLNNNVKHMDVSTIGGIVGIFNKEAELDTEKIDNTSSIISLRKKIKAAQQKKKGTGKN